MTTASFTNNTVTAQFPWATPGAKVALVKYSTYGSDYSVQTVERVTKTQVILSGFGGTRRFTNNRNRNPGLQEKGDSYRRNYLVPMDSDLVARIDATKLAEQLVNAVTSAQAAWDRNHTVEEADNLITAMQAWKLGQQSA